MVGDQLRMRHDLVAGQRLTPLGPGGTGSPAKYLRDGVAAQWDGGEPDCAPHLTALPGG
jgi:hypothetical protein